LLPLNEAAFSIFKDWKGGGFFINQDTWYFIGIKNKPFEEKVMKKEYLLASESVAEGHPDKLCDQISDAILDDILMKDPHGRVACEVATTTGLVMVFGEITTKCYADIPRIVRRVVKEAGYDRPEEYGFDGNSCSVIVSVKEQASDIDIGRSNEADYFDRIGASDQSLMYGYATNETPEYMPFGTVLAHRLMQKQAELRKNGTLEWLRPDGKTQVVVKYQDDKPIGVTSVVFSTQHSIETRHADVEAAVMEEIIYKVIPPELRMKDIQYFVNATGKFVIGGPQANTGFTGRKIIVDTYGGSCPHGGGAFSGKDPTKIERSGAYMARYIAKNIVAAGLSSRCTVQLAYLKGMVNPVAVSIDLHGKGIVDETELSELIPWIFNCKPAAIIKNLNLRRPIYQKTAVYGHFGRELPEFTWEKIDVIEELKEIKSSGSCKKILAGFKEEFEKRLKEKAEKDWKDRNRINSKIRDLRICHSCFELYGDVCENEDLYYQQCSCTKRQTDRITKLRRDYELCYCCGLKIIETGYKFASYYCDQCRGITEKLNNIIGDCVIPIVRDGPMNRGLLRREDVKRDEAIDEFVINVKNMSERFDVLKKHRKNTVQKHVKLLNLAENAPAVQLITSINAARFAELSKKAFKELVATVFGKKAEEVEEFCEKTMKAAYFRW
jgi:S-adenosylmethionine synthetase